MEKAIRVFIVDDEYQSRLVIIKLLNRYFTGLQVAGQADTVSEAVESIQQLQPQIVFLDVRMQHETGFDVLDRLPQTDFEVIFTTAYEEYAIKAIRYSAIDYLIKPIDPTELQTAMQRAIENIKQHQSYTSEQVKLIHQHLGPNPTQKFNNKIAVPTAEGLLFIHTNDIIYCQGQSNYTEIYMANGKVLTSSYTLKNYEDMLASQDFFRIHKSYLINLHHISMYRRGEGGVAVMSNGDEVEVARRNKTSFLNLFKG
jgi:two-component system, LytTR family, response regulator